MAIRCLALGASGVEGVGLLRCARTGPEECIGFVRDRGTSISGLRRECFDKYASGTTQGLRRAHRV